MLGSFIRRAHGTAVIARNLIGQAKVPYLPEDQLRQLRDRRVREIVRYAAQTVPFYRDFFRAERLDPAEIRGAEDLQRLPLIDKLAVRAQPQRFLSTSSRAKTAAPFSTSGTSGVPVKVWHDRCSLLANSAYNERMRAVVRRLLGTNAAYREISVGHPQSMLNKLPQFLQQNRFMPFRGERVYLSALDPLEQVIESINAYRPDVIASASGSYIELLFRTVAARGMRMHLPRVVIYYADAMSPQGKRLIQEDLCIPVVSEYSATEAFKIGFTCEEDSGFHCQDDLTHVRIVDTDGHTVPVGEKGEVVISNLVNHATVLLNYRLGDIASLSKERCPCGRTLRLMPRLEGRLWDIIHLSNGSFVHPAQLTIACTKRMLEDTKGLLQFQVIQHDLDVFELRLATLDREAYDRVIAGLVKDLQALLGPGATIEPVRFADRLPTGPGGKLRPVVSEVEADRLSLAGGMPSSSHRA